MKLDKYRGVSVERQLFIRSYLFKNHYCRSPNSTVITGPLHIILKDSPFNDPFSCCRRRLESLKIDIKKFLKQGIIGQIPLSAC